MNKERLMKFIGYKTMTIVDAMEKIDSNAKGILFIVDSEKGLEGCITDGDIRRWLIRTGSLEATVENAMVSQPKSLFVEEKERAEKFMKTASITAVPLLDKQNQVVDVVIASEIISSENRTKKRQNLSEVPVVIMAGGKGTRLYPYTKILPKPLIPIGETPIVERIIDAYTEYNINSFFMTVNYKAGMIRSYFADLNPKYRIVYIQEEKPLGTAGSIRLIETHFKNPLFVTNCDALILANYGDIYKYHLESGNVITIVSALKNIVVPYGVIHSKENGELTDIEEKPKLSYFINTGMYVINPEIIEKIPANKMFHMTHLVEAVKNDGGKVGIYPISEDSFLDMGEFDEMKRMEEKLNLEDK